MTARLLAAIIIASLYGCATAKPETPTLVCFLAIHAVSGPHTPVMVCVDERDFASVWSNTPHGEEHAQ